MKIVCLVKQVPHPGAIEFDPETQTLRREGVPLQLNPFDRYAVQHAVRLRARGGGEVVVLTMGPPQAEEALRETLALGADRAILLSDRAFAGADTIGTSRTLALALRREGFDLVLCGRKTVDSETWQVPPEVAAFLAVPHLTNAVALEREGATLRATRDADDAEEVWEVPTPALLSVGAAPSDRSEGPGGERIDTWGAAELGGQDDRRFGQDGSPTRVLAVRDVTPRRAGIGVASVDGARRTVERLLEERAQEPSSWEKPPHAAERPAASYDSWVLVETRDGVPTRPSLELLARSRTLAGKLGGRNVALVLGSLGVDLGRHGAELVHRVSRLDGYHPELWGAALRVALERHRPHVLLAPATALGRDVAPRAAGELELGMTGDCVGVDVTKAGRLLQQKPAYGGNIVSVIMGATTPQLATVRPRMYEPLEPRDAVAEARVEEPELPQPRLRLLERRPYDRPGHELEEADRVLFLGERAPDLELDGAIGVTQAVVQRGDAPRHRHVGLLGRPVAPRLLVAVGVPGTVEELCGFVKARVVVSVDGGEAMDARADVVVAGDAPAVARELIG